jgi:hypothetical protein
VRRLVAAFSLREYLNRDALSLKQSVLFMRPFGNTKAVTGHRTPKCLNTFHIYLTSTQS